MSLYPPQWGSPPLWSPPGGCWRQCRCSRRRRCGWLWWREAGRSVAPRQAVALLRLQGETETHTEVVRWRMGGDQEDCFWWCTSGKMGFVINTDVGGNDPWWWISPPSVCCRLCFCLFPWKSHLSSLARKGKKGALCILDGIVTQEGPK